MAWPCVVVMSIAQRVAVAQGGRALLTPDCSKNARPFIVVRTYEVFPISELLAMDVFGENEKHISNKLTMNRFMISSFVQIVT